MSDTTRDEMELRDEDRLPWLEPAEDFDEEEGISPAKLAAFVIAGLVAIGIVIGGIYWWQGRQARAVGGEGELIAAQEGDYKVKPDQPGGMAVEGKGDTQFATSAGEAPKGAIDLDALPEAPVERAAPAPAAQPKAQPQAQAKGVAAVPESGGRLAPKAPAAQPGAPARAAAGGALIQLGAFSSESAANKAWERLSKRFAFLGPLTQSVASTQVSGATLYRLCATAASGEQARDFCGRLKVGGENCIVVS
jgi:SPOR domain